MGDCIFAEEVPEVEVRNGIVFVVHKNGRSVAISVANLQKFITKCNRVLSDWRVDQSGKVEQISHWRDHAASS